MVRKRRTDTWQPTYNTIFFNGYSDLKCFIKLHFSYFIHNQIYLNSFKQQGPVVRSVVSLTSSLRGQHKCFKALLNSLIIFVEKNERSFAMQKLLTFFNQNSDIFQILTFGFFNETLTNDVVSFEQPGPGTHTCKCDEDDQTSQI